MSGRVRVQIWRVAAAVVVVIAVASAASGADGTREATPIRPPTPKDFSVSAQRVHDALAALDAFLEKTSAENAAAWRDFLRYEMTKSLLAQDAPDARDMDDIVRQYISGEPGLELPAFVGVREALVGHQRLLLMQQQPDAMERLFRDYLGFIYETLENETLTNDQRVGLMARLRWLEDVHQAPELVATVRQRFGQANFIVSTSAEALALGLTRPVDDVRPLNEVIMGVRLRGSSTTSGYVTPRLLPSADGAIVELLLSGTTRSRSRGSERSVTVTGNATTQVHVCKVVVIDANGIHTQPSRASCTTRSRIRGIHVQRRLGRRLISRIAARRANEQRPMVERISARRAEARFARLMDREVDTIVASGRSRIGQRLRHPLERLNMFPRRMHFSSSPQHLNMVAWQGRSAQLAACTPPPDVAGQNLIIKLHESAILNSSVNAIGGLSVDDQRAAQLARELLGRVPAALDDTSEDYEPWSITFDSRQPLQTEFDNGLMTISIRGSRFVRGDRELNRQLEISADYAIEIQNGRALFVRQGDVGVRYLGRGADRVRLRDYPDITFISRRFEAIFRDEFSGAGVPLPGNWERLREFDLEYVSADAGWLVLGWK